MLEPAPAGFEFDDVEVASELASALRIEAPELFARLEAGELRWFADLDEDRLPRVVVSSASG